MTEVTIPLRSHDEAVLVLGPYDRYAKLLRQELGIDLFTRRGNLRLKGEAENLAEAQRRIEHLLGKSRKGRSLDLQEIERILLGEPSSSSGGGSGGGSTSGGGAGSSHATRSPSRFAGSSGGSDRRTSVQGKVRAVEPRTENQRRYLDAIDRSDLVFGVGPAGTGKTFLAVAAAVKYLRTGVVRRLVITRPVVEAGEHLGFLPGDLAAKLNPYMRPIYDALHGLLDFEEVGRLEEAGVIEVAPLAYMRGRTLSKAFVILDEGQNSTVGQMKMFLTRLGEGSKMVVTGDPSQNDLEHDARSGLNDALRRLKGIGDIMVNEFSSHDIVRHPLVSQIVKAYDASATKRPRRDEASSEEA